MTYDKTALSILLESKLTSPPKGVVLSGHDIIIGGARSPLDSNDGRAKMDAVDQWAKENGGHVVWNPKRGSEGLGRYKAGAGPVWREQLK